MVSQENKITMALVVLLILLLITASFIARKSYDSPCSYFDENTPMAQLPARCIKYFAK